MDWKKQAQIAQYLVDNEQVFGASERLNWPRVLTFAVAKLPHNDILDDEFWNALGNSHTINIAHQPDGTWELGL